MSGSLSLKKGIFGSFQIGTDVSQYSKIHSILKGCSKKS
jgi:hypothetical protein